MSIFPSPPLVIVESPYKASDGYTLEQHRAYLLHALADCYRRGEAPFASHHLATEVLDDDTPYERAVGIRCGLAWGQHADLIAIYSDLGVSRGMKEATEHYKSLGKPIEWRSLPDRIVRAVRDMGATTEMEKPHEESTLRPGWVYVSYCGGSKCSGICLGHRPDERTD
jgi:hypothetical protein